MGEPGPAGSLAGGKNGPVSDAAIRFGERGHLRGQGFSMAGIDLELAGAVLAADSDYLVVEPDWETTDHTGYGTQMCGIAAFGDLSKALQQSGPIEVNHCLESVKNLPPLGENDPDLYGDITIQGLSRAEIHTPTRNRIACMAVTSEDTRDQGRPSSWWYGNIMRIFGYGVPDVFKFNPFVSSVRVFLYIIPDCGIETRRSAYQPHVWGST